MSADYINFWFEYGIYFIAIFILGLVLHAFLFAWIVSAIIKRNDK